MKNKMALITKFRDILRSYRNNVAIRYYEKKIRTNKEIFDLIEVFRKSNGLENHYANIKIEESNIISHLEIQLSELISTTKLRLGKSYKSDRFLDAGDSDGIVLKSLGIASGVSFNIREDCVKLIKQNGGNPVRGTLEFLPFKDKSFENAICFETLEHLDNPIRGLLELSRVTSRLFISIPWMRNTRIHPRGIDHVFEFNYDDFNKILSRTDFDVNCYQEIKIFPKILNPINYFILRFFYFRSFFPKLQFYELIKKENNDA